MAKSRRVFVVEDSATQRAQITQMLTSAGFEVVSIDNAVDALVQLKSLRPDAVVSDIVMPDMSGFEFCTKFKELDSAADIPFILLTSLTDTKDVLKGLECGADGFVVKPVEDSYLAKLLSGLIASPENKSHIDDRGRLIYLYRGEEFALDHDYTRLLRLLTTSFESTADLNRKLSKAHIQLKNQAMQLRRKVNTQAFKIDQQLEEHRNVESQLYHYQRMEAVDRLAGAVAHDFNNMLMVIKGFTDFLLKDTPEEDKRHTYLTEISKASDRAAELTNQLLIFSRKQEFREEAFDVNRLLLEIKSMVVSILGDQIKSSYRLDDRPLMIHADKQQIEQVIINLVTNARDALIDGGSCTISSALCDIVEADPEAQEGIPPGSYVRIEVKDDGCGMTRETLESIFDPFFTTKEKGKGTGLGLSTVFGVIRKSGGYILCSSIVDAGTSITIFIPSISGKEAVE